MSNAVPAAAGGRYGLVHANMTWNITPLAGPKDGVPYTVKTCTSFDYGINPKYGSIGGTQYRPVTVSLTGSEPKYSAEISKIELKEIHAYIGPGWAGIPCNFDITWQVLGTTNSAFTDSFEICYIGDDGTASKYGSDNVMTKIGSPCANIVEDGIDAFDRDAG